MFSFFKPKPDYEKNIDKYFEENENIINLNNSLFFFRNNVLSYKDKTIQNNINNLTKYIEIIIEDIETIINNNNNNNNNNNIKEELYRLEKYKELIKNVIDIVNNISKNNNLESLNNKNNSKYEQIKIDLLNNYLEKYYKENKENNALTRLDKKINEINEIKEYNSKIESKGGRKSKRKTKKQKKIKRNKSIYKK
jgi:hypothetical protein